MKITKLPKTEAGEMGDYYYEKHKLPYANQRTIDPQEYVSDPTIDEMWDVGDDTTDDHNQLGFVLLRGNTVEIIDTTSGERIMITLGDKKTITPRERRFINEALALRKKGGRP